MIETNHDEKMLQNDPHRPWPVKQRIQSRHGHLSNAAAAAVIEQLLPGKLGRIVLGHLSRDCNSPELAAGTIRAQLEKCGRRDIEIFCAAQSEISPRFTIGETRAGALSTDLRKLVLRDRQPRAVKLRDATEADLPAIVDIYNATIPTGW